MFRGIGLRGLVATPKGARGSFVRGCPPPPRRLHAVVLAVAMASLLAGCVGVDGSGSACDAACRHGSRCGWTTERTADCFQICQEAQAPDSFYRCVARMSCEDVLDPDAPLERCGRVFF